MSRADVIIRSVPPPECHLWFLSVPPRSPFRKSSFLSNRPPPSLMKAYRIQLTGGIGMFCDLYPVRNSINVLQFNGEQPSCKLNRSKTERNCYVAYSPRLLRWETTRRGKPLDKINNICGFSPLSCDFQPSTFNNSGNIYISIE